jgi:Na+/phosphate symporter
MITVYVPPLVMLVGVLMYALSANPKLQEIGRIMFAFGLLVTLMWMANTKALNL